MLVVADVLHEGELDGGQAKGDVRWGLGRVPLVSGRRRENEGGGIFCVSRNARLACFVTRR